MRVGYFKNIHFHPNGYQSLQKKSEKEKNFHRKKVIVSVFFSSNGVQSVMFLPKNERFTSEFFHINIISDLETNIKKKRPVKGLKDIILHFDNAKTHTSKASLEKLSTLGINRMPHPLYSPDISPCDFYLFGKLKELLKGEIMENEEDLKKKSTQNPKKNSEI